ncbi:hypothetical protein [Sphingomonas faeni]|uniref:hypothetical protein n=1 Tax=Sphingomonas faeni TaxID=185950 RepID=UPI00335BE548
MLIEHLHIGSPVVRVMAGLLPHLPAPVVFAPSRNSPVPQGCLHLPAADLLVAGAAGPVAPALILVDDIARRTQCDVILVSLREPSHAHAVRFDVVFAGLDRTEHVHDLLLWRMKNRATALVPIGRYGQSVVLGRSGLIPSEPPPYPGPVERMQGVALGTAELRRTLCDEEA